MPSLRVLLIDADPSDRLAMRNALEASGLPVELDEAVDAAQALAKVASQPYDCLLLDRELPEMSGVALAKNLRVAGHQVPIVFVTGLGDEELLQQAVEAGVTDFMPDTDRSPRRLRLRVEVAVRNGRVEAELAQSLARANAATRARDEVLAIVSHDLRGPLNSISLACDGLVAGLDADEHRECVLAIERAALRCERLIKDLLSVAHIESGRLELDLRTFDAGELAHRACLELELEAAAARCTIAVSAPVEPLPMRGDRDRLHQVLSNLIGNALTHARGTAVEVSVSARPDALVLAVADAGPGIAPEELPRIFERYRQGKTHHGGAGLGLAIVKGLVEAHHGTVAVRSQPGRGTRFEVTLPRDPARG